MKPNEMKPNDYYKSQLNNVDYHTEYPPTFKIRGKNGETKWLDLNKESAEALISKLKMEFKITLL
jgi:hypothetical protein